MLLSATYCGWQRWTPFFYVEAIYEFNDDMEKYWRICFGDGSQREYRYNDLQVEESCLSEKQSANVLSYIRKIANLSEIRVEETGKKYCLRCLIK